MTYRDPSSGEEYDLEPTEDEPEDVAFLDFTAARKLLEPKPDGPEAA